jgi:hypothetical protein
MITQNRTCFLLLLLLAVSAPRPVLAQAERDLIPVVTATLNHLRLSGGAATTSWIEALPTNAEAVLSAMNGQLGQWSLRHVPRGEALDCSDGNCRLRVDGLVYRINELKINGGDARLEFDLVQPLQGHDHGHTMTTRLLILRRNGNTWKVLQDRIIAIG